MRRAIDLRAIARGRRKRVERDRRKVDAERVEIDTKVELKGL